MIPTVDKQVMMDGSLDENMKNLTITCMHVSIATISVFTFAWSCNYLFHLYCVVQLVAQTIDVCDQVKHTTASLSGDLKKDKLLCKRLRMRG